jgi:hypothetical protein
MDYPSSHCHFRRKPLSINREGGVDKTRIGEELAYCRKAEPIENLVHEFVPCSSASCGRSCESAQADAVDQGLISGEPPTGTETLLGLYFTSRTKKPGS